MNSFNKGDENRLRDLQNDYCFIGILHPLWKVFDIEVVVGNMDPNRDDLDYQLNQDKLNSRWNHKTEMRVYTEI